MKKYLLALALLLTVPGVVSAQSDENVTKRRPDRPAQAEIQQIGQENRVNVAENHSRRLERRFRFYVERLDKIMARFQTRLDLLKAEGKSTTSTQTKLDAAKAKLTEAKAKGEEAVAAFKAIDPAKLSQQRTELFAARDLAVTARKLFQETHELLKLALKELKTISKPALPAASAAVNKPL